MIINDIVAFQNVIKDKKIIKNDNFLNKIVQQFHCYLINNEQDIKNEIKEHENESKIIILDKISGLDPYFLVIFNNQIIFILDLLLLPKLFNNFEKYQIFTFSESPDSEFPKELQNIIYRYEDTEKKTFLQIISNLCTNSNVFIPGKTGFGNISN